MVEGAGAAGEVETKLDRPARASFLKKAMFLATPAMALLFVAALAWRLSAAPEVVVQPKPPTVIVEDKDVRLLKQAATLRVSAFRLLEDASKRPPPAPDASKGPAAPAVSKDAPAAPPELSPEARRALVLKAQDQLREAQGIIDGVRERQPEAVAGKSYQFEEEAQHVNSGIKVARTIMMELGK